jgi:nucleoside-diphosphate-sugar epimerase
MKVMVTGHEGYIGSELLPMLLSAGCDVTGVDMGYFREQPLPPDTDSFHTMRKDIRDLDHRDLGGFDAVIHLAALSNDPMGNLNEDWTFEINHRASVRLARLAKDAGVSRYLFASSCSVYGLAESDKLVTEESPVHPLTAYAVSKVRTEEDVSKLADAGFSPVFLRNSTAYGWSRRFRADLVLNNLACWAYTAGEIRILSDGTPWRPLVHVQDIGRAFMAVLDAPRDVIHNQVINIGSSDQNYMVRELASFVKEAIPGSQVSYAEGGGPDPRSYRVDFGKLNRLLPMYQPAWDARSGARQLAGAFRMADLKPEEFTGPRYVRLAQLKKLMEDGRLDGGLRWNA